LLLCLTLLQFQAHAADRSSPAPGMVSTVPGADLWREVRQRDGMISDGISQVKGVDTGVLINVQGDKWARFRINNPVKHAPTVIIVVILVLLLFYVIRGKVKIEGGLSGRMVLRFTDFERILHWTLAIVFLFLAVTGLVVLVGRPLLIPLFGKSAFSLLASASKEGHNLFGPIFLISLLMMLYSFARRNIYEKGDLSWLLKGGGFIGKGHVSGGFFNMGEKSWYWLVILVGLLISVSGLILVSPSFGQGRVIMEISHVVHVLGAIILMAVSIGHMYMGSIGTEGSSEAMKSGYVDINWVEAHHDRWAKECHAKDLVISAEEFARVQGSSLDQANVEATEQAK
jgi:formate dehydrogenase subunit gamma